MMKITTKRFFFQIFFLFYAALAINAETEVAVNKLMIDDFSREVSALGTSWEGFSDQVMGGKSEMQSRIVTEDGQRFLSLSGTVSLANNGGFIQTRLLLSPKKNGLFDGTPYSGLRLSARGKGTGYYIFLRTSANVFPWSFYMAPFPVTGEWSTIDIPWSSFKKGDFGSFFKLNLKKLTSIAIVAYKQEFQAAIDVREISFY